MTQFNSRSVHALCTRVLQSSSASYESDGRYFRSRTAKYGAFSLSNYGDQFHVDKAGVPRDVLFDRFLNQGTSIFDLHGSHDCMIAFPESFPRGSWQLRDIEATARASSFRVVSGIPVLSMTSPDRLVSVVTEATEPWLFAVLQELERSR